MPIDRPFGHGWNSYVQSVAYPGHAAAARRVWGDPETLKTAGAGVFVTYLALPTLSEIRSGHGHPARSVLDGRRERTFLLRVVGLQADGDYRGGIANPRVRQLCADLRTRHLRFPGLSLEHLHLVAALIALLPLDVAAVYGATPPEPVRTAYWQYMTNAMSLLGADLASPDDERQRTSVYITRHAGWTTGTAHSLADLRCRHQVYFERCLPALDPAVRRIALLSVERSACVPG